MKSLMLLLDTMLYDSSIKCCVSTSRDRKTILSRTNSEGLSFLTITLPSFCKDFEKSLKQGAISKHDFLGFKRNRGLPAFLQGFLSLVFDRDTGLILHTPSIDAIFCVRQLCLAFKKFRAECSKARTRAALEQYVLTDLEVASFEASLPEYVSDVFTDAFGFLFGPVLRKLDAQIADDITVIIPKHGPGTTADRTLYNMKYNYRVWTERLEKVAPLSKFVVPNDGFKDWADSFSILSPRDEPPVRVITVPKTLKTPRIIAVEPVHMQYMQQGLMELLVPLLESPELHGALGFTDQTVNQGLARLGSKYGWFATLDLSEASDRVSNQLVLDGFRLYPALSRVIQACRSTHADVPGYGIHPISKFASMGSALCFPIEAMVFCTILFISVYGSKDKTWTSEDRSSFLKQVRVYGDDIILPVEWTHNAMCELSRFNLKVNQHKSFWTGKFRESCGGDYFNGESVKPVYIKECIPASLAEVSAMEATVAARNQFYSNGFWKTTALIDDCIRRLAPFPIVSPSSPCLGRHSVFEPRGSKLCVRLHRPLVRGLVRRSVFRLSELDGPGALMKHFLKRGENPFHDKEHLHRGGRPKSASLQLRWVPMQ